MNTRVVYLDNQSATRIDERVYDEMLPYLKENYGNPQNLYSLGSKAKDALDKARQQTAELISAEPREIIFTSCGSEANNLAIKGIAQTNTEKGKHIVVSAIEHFSILHAAKRLKSFGFEITTVDVDKFGTIKFEELEKAIRPDTTLVSIQHANTEIGTIQSLAKISKTVKEKSTNALFHTDAVGTAGIIDIDVKKLGIDALTFSGSQFYGPKGAAALYIKKGARMIPQIDGGIQEEGMRAGTENIPAIVGLGKACEIAKSEMLGNNKKMLFLRDKLIAELPKKIKHIYLNGHPHERLPNNANFSIEFIEGEGILLFLNQKGVCVSSGSACTSKALKLSHVLEAIKVDPSVAQGSVLFSLSKYNTSEDIDYVLSELPPIVERLRSMSPLYAHFIKTGERMKAGPGTDYNHNHKTEE